MISSSLSPCETVITKFQVRGMLLSIFFNTFGESKFCSDRFPGLCLGVSSEISELPLLRIGWAALSVSQSKVPGRPGPPSDVWLTTLPVASHFSQATAAPFPLAPNFLSSRETFLEPRCMCVLIFTLSSEASREATQRHPGCSPLKMSH